MDGIKALGHEVKGRITQDEGWREFERLLKLHKVMFVILDEAQNALENANILDLGAIDCCNGEALSARQVRRLLERIRASGAASLRHKAIGRPPNNKICDEVRDYA